MKDYKKHIEENHETELNCGFCEITSRIHSELEINIKDNHQEEESHECEECDKAVLSELSLKMHMIRVTEQIFENLAQ